MSDESAKLIALCRSYARPEVETRYLTETAQHFRALGDHIEALCAGLAKMTEERDRWKNREEAAIRVSDQALGRATAETQIHKSRAEAAEAALARMKADFQELQDLAQKAGIQDGNRIACLTAELARMKAQGTFAEGVEAAAKVAREGCLVPPDGGSPTTEEVVLCEEIERRIRALAPPKPAEEPQS